MKRWLTLMAIVLVLALLSACGGAAGPGPATGGAKPTGDLVVAETNLGEEQWHIGRGGTVQVVAWEQVYEMPFFVKEASFELVPGLAEKFEVSPDAKSLTMWVRKGVPWHDSEKWGEVTAEDIKFTYELAKAEGSTNSRVNAMRQIQSMEIIDPYQLKITLKQPDPIWWHMLEVNTSPYDPIVSKKYFETVGPDEAGKTPIGTGPYRLVQHQPKSLMKFEALEKHWRLVPEFKTLTIRVVPEESTRIAMLKTAEIDATGITSVNMEDVKKAGLAAETPSYGGGVLSLSFGGLINEKDPAYKKDYHNKGPFADARVRQALNLAIDRAAIAKALFFGAATPAQNAFAAPNWDKFPLYPYDVAKAKSLLAEAGYANGFAFDFYSWERPGTPEIPAVIEAVAAYWQQNLGLKPKIVKSDLDTYNRLVRPRNHANTMAPNRWSTRMDQTERIFAYFLANSDRVYFSTAELEKVSQDLIATVDPVKRDAAWNVFFKYMYENYTTVPLLNIPNNYAYNTKKVQQGSWPHGQAPYPTYWMYMKHTQPLNTFRLFTP